MTESQTIVLVRTFPPAVQIYFQSAHCVDIIGALKYELFLSRFFLMVFGK